VTSGLYQASPAGTRAKIFVFAAISPISWAKSVFIVGSAASSAAMCGNCLTSIACTCAGVMCIACASAGTSFCPSTSIPSKPFPYPWNFATACGLIAGATFPSGTKTLS
jgi:hypothetical protein